MIRLELFRGIRSLGTVSWEPAGWVRLRVSDPEAAQALLEALGGPASKDETPEGEVRFKPEELTATAFEETCLAFAREHGYLVAPRPAPPGSPSA